MYKLNSKACLLGALWVISALFCSNAIAWSSPPWSPPPPPPAHKITNISGYPNTGSYKHHNGTWYTKHTFYFTAVGSRSVKIEDIASQVMHENCSLSHCTAWLADNASHAVRFLSQAH